MVRSHHVFRLLQPLIDRHTTLTTLKIHRGDESNVSPFFYFVFLPLLHAFNDLNLLVCEAERG
jgi:hypothetical protein